MDAQIGEGSFAEVFSAEMTVVRAVGKVKGEKRKVALKIVKDAADLGIGPDCEVSYDDVLYAVRQEVKVAERIGRHPNVVNVLGSAERGTVLVMELAKSDLSQVVRRARRAGRQVPLALIGTWSKDILAGVAHIHSTGVMHMDVKSGNVLIDQNGTAMLTDFGLAIQDTGTIEVPPSPSRTHYLSLTHTICLSLSLSPCISLSHTLCLTHTLPLSQRYKNLNYEPFSGGPGADDAVVPRARAADGQGLDRRKRRLVGRGRRHPRDAHRSAPLPCRPPALSLPPSTLDPGPSTLDLNPQPPALP